jgi:hypothetical protein
MPQIEIDFEVWKILTSRRVHENHTYNEVLREVLQLDSDLEPVSAAEAILEGRTEPRGLGFGLIAASGFSSRDLFLPNGTLLRATYKQKIYVAKIESGRWIDDEGLEFSSPSSAANRITGKNVNGLRFWQAKRPSDESWFRLDYLR